MANTTLLSVKTFIVIGRADGTSFGPFETEDAAIAWAKTIYWQHGYYVRPINPIGEHHEETQTPNALAASTY